MKPIVATLLATALSAAIGSAYAQTDTAAYRSSTQKAAADYKAAAGECKIQSGAARTLCVEEAKVSRARAEVNAVNEHNNTLAGRAKARTALVNAEYSLAKTKCAGTSGAEKDSCLSNARSVQTAALANVKADRDIAVAANVDSTGAITNTNPADPTKAAAVDKCAQVAGNSATGCLIDNKTGAVTTVGGTVNNAANTTANSAATVADRTRTAAANAAERTGNAMENLGDKTRAAATTVANKTERAIDSVAAKTDRATDNVAPRAGAAVADSVITTKVKADLFKEPELKSMAIHVETEKGVVMLSGFVDSKADADKAERLAKGVEGVAQVKSAIKVK